MYWGSALCTIPQDARCLGAEPAARACVYVRVFVCVRNYVRSCVSVLSCLCKCESTYVALSALGT